jgi:hypothetical protein
MLHAVVKDSAGKVLNSNFIPMVESVITIQNSTFVAQPLLWICGSVLISVHAIFLECNATSDVHSWCGHHFF